MDKHCPYCQGGQDKRTYTEAGLVGHLRKFHRTADYADIIGLSFRLAKEDIVSRLALCKGKPACPETRPQIPSTLVVRGRTSYRLLSLVSPTP